MQYLNTIFRVCLHLNPGVISVIPTLHCFFVEKNLCSVWNCLKIHMLPEGKATEYTLKTYLDPDLPIKQGPNLTLQKVGRHVMDRNAAQFDRLRHELLSR